MTEVLAGGFGFAVASVLFTALVVRYQALVVRAFRESEREHREERARLTERLAIRTAETPAEAAAQRTTTRPPTPHPLAETDEVRKAAVGRAQPIGLGG